MVISRIIILLKTTTVCMGIHQRRALNSELIPFHSFSQFFFFFTFLLASLLNTRDGDYVHNKTLKLTHTSRHVSFEMPTFIAAKKN